MGVSSPCGFMNLRLLLRKILWVVLCEVLSGKFLYSIFFGRGALYISAKGISVLVSNTVRLKSESSWNNGTACLFI